MPGGAESKIENRQLKTGQPGMGVTGCQLSVVGFSLVWFELGLTP
jgi:hypothetical protein